MKRKKIIEKSLAWTIIFFPPKSRKLAIFAKETKYRKLGQKF
jgi:hypothetical protein